MQRWVTTLSRRQVSPGLHLTTRWQVRQRSEWYERMRESTAWRGGAARGGAGRGGAAGGPAGVRGKFIFVEEVGKKAPGFLITSTRGAPTGASISRPLRVIVATG